MSTYEQYLRRKALLEFYNNLSDDDKVLLREMNKKRSVINNDSRPLSVDCRDPYWRGVSQNIVGDAIFSAGTTILRNLLTKVRL